MLLIPVNIFSDMLGPFLQSFWVEPAKQQIKRLAQGHNTMTLLAVSLELETL